VNPTVDIKEAASLLKVHHKTVEDLISAGAFPAGKVGRSYVMMTSDVLRYIEQIIVKQTADRMGTPVRHQSRSAKSLPRKLA
jgi:excisionase family DNA binding protein